MRYKEKEKDESIKPKTTSLFVLIQITKKKMKKKNQFIPKELMSEEHTHKKYT